MYIQYEKISIFYRIVLIKKGYSMQSVLFVEIAQRCHLNYKLHVWFSSIFSIKKSSASLHFYESVCQLGCPYVTHLISGNCDFVSLFPSQTFIVPRTPVDLIFFISLCFSRCNVCLCLSLLSPFPSFSVCLIDLRHRSTYCGNNIMFRCVLVTVAKAFVSSKM